MMDMEEIESVVSRREEISEFINEEELIKVRTR